MATVLAGGCGVRGSCLQEAFIKTLGGFAKSV